MASKEDDGRVGYKRPPTHTRFKPGQSGNPKGRPKHARNLKTEFLEELGEVILVREGGREMKITKQRAFVKALVAAAIKGDMRATSAIVSFCTRAFGNEPEDDQPQSTRVRRSRRFSRSSSVAKSGAAPPKATRMVIFHLNHKLGKPTHEK